MLRTKKPALVQYCGRLTYEIISLRPEIPTLKFYTVQHATRLMCIRTLGGYVEDLNRAINELKEWFANPSYSSDNQTIVDITDRLISVDSEINKTADQYLDENETDVRDIIDPDKWIELVDNLMYVLMFSELHKCSSAITILQGIAIKLLDGIIKDVVVHAQEYIHAPDAPAHNPDDNPWDGRDEMLKKFNAWDEPVKAGELPPPSVYLQFIRHEEQVVFNDTEKEAILEEERRIQDEQAYAKELATRCMYSESRMKELLKIAEEYMHRYKFAIENASAYKSPTTMHECDEADCAYDAVKSLGRTKTTVEGMQILDDVCTSKEPYYFSTKIPHRIAAMLSKLTNDQLALVNLDTHEEYPPAVEAEDLPSVGVMIIHR